MKPIINFFKIVTLAVVLSSTGTVKAVNISASSKQCDALEDEIFYCKSRNAVTVVLCQPKEADNSTIHLKITGPRYIVDHVYDYSKDYEHFSYGRIPVNFSPQLGRLPESVLISVSNEHFFELFWQGFVSARDRGERRPLLAEGALDMVGSSVECIPSSIRQQFNKYKYKEY